MIINEKELKKRIKKAWNDGKISVSTSEDGNWLMIALEDIKAVIDVNAVSKGVKAAIVETIGYIPEAGWMATSGKDVNEIAEKILEDPSADVFVAKESSYAVSVLQLDVSNIGECRVLQRLNDCEKYLVREKSLSLIALRKSTDIHRVLESELVPLGYIWCADEESAIGIEPLLQIEYENEQITIDAISELSIDLHTNQYLF